MALIPPFFLDCVVAIGTDDYDAERVWIASGFLYGRYLKQEAAEKIYQVFLVTNRHVLEGLSRVYLRFNPLEGEAAKELPLDLTDNDGNAIWMAADDSQIDVAVIPIELSRLTGAGVRFAFFKSDEHVANVEKMNALGITEGDFAYVLGFPMGQVGGDKNYVIVRSGTVARIRDVLASVSSEFLVDAFIFPGNSGGPVVSKPELMAVAGTKPQTTAHLIGIVSGYATYRDIAISQLTGRQRVIFEENSGLAAAHPIDFVETIIDGFNGNRSPSNPA